MCSVHRKSHTCVYLLLMYLFLGLQKEKNFAKEEGRKLNLDIRHDRKHWMASNMALKMVAEFTVDVHHRLLKEATEWLLWYRH